MKTTRTPKTHLIWAQRQRRIKLEFKLVQALVTAALPLCLKKPRYPEARLPDVVEISIVSDRVITKVHEEFLDDPTPTDVITFAHSEELGEILIGAETVATHALNFNQTLEQEIARCVLHGLLHLLGYDDTTPEEYVLMHEQQEKLLQLNMA
ncbi:MAG: rRNA maturation RNase YbeY [Chthoniobacterales bacterium]|nr:rRNA maturation RNase YbeY [Chthoniobacterales bacterium]